MVELLICVYYLHLHSYLNWPALCWEIDFWTLPVGRENAKRLLTFFTRLARCVSHCLVGSRFYIYGEWFINLETMKSTNEYQHSPAQAH